VDDGDQRIGTTVKGKWRIDARLGAGGMATVYAATHRNGKRVAIKILHAELSAIPEVRARFLREGYAANAVGHRGAVTVDDDDVAEDGAAFLVMELLEGETLEARRHRRGGALPAEEVLRCVDQLLDVLAAAHEKGIVHRDLKPENLFLTSEGVLKVLDFGIARLRDGSMTGPGTKAGAIMGTPAFMAPEQARARWDLVDGRTDLWAVGASMFTLISGQYVRDAATTNEELALAITTPAPSIATVAPHLSPRVVHLVDRAMAHQIDQRWASAHAMREALQAALAEPVVAKGSPPVPPVQHASAGTISPGTTTIRSTVGSASRRPWIGLVVGAGLVVAGVAVWAMRARTPPSVAAARAEPTQSAAPTASASVTPTPVSSAVPTSRAISLADLPDVAPQPTARAAVAPRPRATSSPAPSAHPATTATPPPPPPPPPAQETPQPDPFSARR
jgi:serine/threonine-protein kinase